MGWLIHIAGFIATYLTWTLAIYWLHRLGHVRSRWNILYKVHIAHHRINYLASDEPLDPAPRYLKYLFWLGDWKTSMDVVLVLTLPLVLITLVVPQYGVPLLVFHYLYEVFLSEAVLDHNTRLKGPITRVFAWGHFHLHHHRFPRTNYALLITLWDYVFGTARIPPEDFLERYGRRKMTDSPDSSRGRVSGAGAGAAQTGTA